MKRATRKQVVKVATQLGCTIEDDWYYYRGTLSVLAPKGKVFVCRDVHVVVEHYCLGEKAFAWGDLLEDLRDGLTPCTDSDCAVCEEEVE